MWRIHIRIILIIIIITVISGIIFVLTSYRYLSKPESINLSKLATNVDIGLQTVHHVAVKDGKKKWDLQSESVQHVSSDSFFSPLTLTFFPNKGEAIDLLSDRGCVKDNKNIAIIGNIVIKQSPWTISCEELIYSYTNDDISAKNNISISGPGVKLTANALSYDLSTNVVTITNDVSITMTQTKALNR
jgi:LPS export ABC transporter protein LptC